ncbi:MAG: RHS repeat-associated core domain-containing protein [Firmicutes bacterium]|nr:RHS repeat-associated core domain-containing protein [Bacillota bacterium]
MRYKYGVSISSSEPTYDRNLCYYRNGWLQKIQDSGLPNSVPFIYNYYDNGNIASETSCAGSENYTYDSNNRLTQWTYIPTSGSTVQQNYAYDAAGNLTNKGGTSYSYNNANHITNAGFTYDHNGNLTSDGTRTYTYNALDQLVQVTGGGITATYEYDYSGLRTSKTVNGVTTTYSWDALGRLVKETASGSYTYYTYDANGNILGLDRASDNTYIVHTNQRGDVVSVTDKTHTIVAQYQYDPWGTITSYTGTLNQPYRYAGYWYDEETGLYYLKSRYYSPTLGRFLTRDAHGYINITNPKTLNLYAYCGNNPVNRTDPSGTTPGYNDATGECTNNQPGVTYTDVSVAVYTDDEGNITGYSVNGNYISTESSWSGTRGIGLSGQTEAGLVLSVNWQVVWDGQGNKGITLTFVPLTGGGTIDASLCGVYSRTGAMTINDLGGWSTNFGGSVGYVVTGGVERTYGNNYTGMTYSGGVGVAPAEVHATRSYTIMVYKWK